MNEEINETTTVDQQPNEQLNEQPSEQPAEDTQQLSEEDLAFALWSLQVGSYLQSLVSSDPLAAADEFEATARHLRQLAQPQPEAQEQPKPEPQPEPKPEQSPAQPNIEDLVQKAVREAIQQAMTELRKSALRSPNSLNAPPASAKRLADLIE